MSLTTSGSLLRTQASREDEDSDVEMMLDTRNGGRRSQPKSSEPDIIEIPSDDDEAYVTACDGQQPSNHVLAGFPGIGVDKIYASDNEAGQRTYVERGHPDQEARMTLEDLLASEAEDSDEENDSSCSSVQSLSDILATATVYPPKKKSEEKGKTPADEHSSPAKKPVDCETGSAVVDVPPAAGRVSDIGSAVCISPSEKITNHDTGTEVSSMRSREIPKRYAHIQPGDTVMIPATVLDFPEKNGEHWFVRIEPFVRCSDCQPDPSLASAVFSDKGPEKRNPRQRREPNRYTVDHTISDRKETADHKKDKSAGSVGHAADETAPKPSGPPLRRPSMISPQTGRVCARKRKKSRKDQHKHDSNEAGTDYVETASESSNRKRPVVNNQWGDSRACSESMNGDEGRAKTSRREGGMSVSKRAQKPVTQHQQSTPEVSSQRKSTRRKTSPLDRRRQLFTSVHVTRDPCQSDREGAGVVAQRLLRKGEVLYDFAAVYAHGDPPSHLDHQRADYILVRQGYVLLIASMTEWLNEALKGQNPNIKWAMRYFEGGACKDGSLGSYHVLQWEVLRDINEGDELLVEYRNGSKKQSIGCGKLA